MERFLVSARKYRPIRFADVVGQEGVTITLRNAIKSEKVGHAFLFCGPRGVGKTTCARILARALNCENLTSDAEPCGKCRSCQTYERSASFNIHELDAASNNSVDDMRSLIEQVRFMPQEGKYKIYIIDEVHMLSQAAFNAFLKTLEEPPHYAIFIMATTEKHKVLSTIISRCQIHDFKRVAIDDMIPYLENICQKEGIAYDRDALYVIAQKADGALRDSLSIFDKAVSFGDGKIELQTVLESLNVLDSDVYFAITDALLKADTAACLNAYDKVLSSGFEGDAFLEGLAQHFRDLLVCKHPETAKLIEVSGKYRQRYAEQAMVAEGGKLLWWLRIINQADVGYRMSRNKRLHVELALIQMAQPVAVDDPKKKQWSPPAEPPASRLSVSKPIVASKEVKPPASGDPEPIKADKLPVPDPVSQARNGGARRFQPSLDKVIREVLKPKDDPAVAEVEEVGEELDSQAVSSAWRNIVRRLRDERKAALATTLERYHPVPVGPGTLKVMVADQRDLKHIQEEKQAITDSIKEQLRTQYLQLQVEYRKEESANTETRPYTDRDKFDLMAKVNPAILKLKEKLDLDFEY